MAINIRNRLVIVPICILVLLLSLIVVPNSFTTDFSFYRERNVYLNSFDLSSNFSSISGKNIEESISFPDSFSDCFEIYVGNAFSGSFTVSLFENMNEVYYWNSIDCSEINNGWLRFNVPINTILPNTNYILKITSSVSNNYEVCFTSDNELSMYLDGAKLNYVVPLKTTVSFFNFGFIPLLFLFVFYTVWILTAKKITWKSFVLFSLIPIILMCAFVPFPFTSTERNDYISAQSISNQSNLSTIDSGTKLNGYWLNDNLLQTDYPYTDATVNVTSKNFYVVNDDYTSILLKLVLSIPSILLQLLSGSNGYSCNVLIFSSRLYVALLYVFISSVSILKSKQFVKVTYALSFAGIFLSFPFTISAFPVVYACVVLFLVICFENSFDNSYSFNMSSVVCIAISYLCFSSYIGFMLSPLIVFSFLIKSFYSSKQKLLTYSILLLGFALTVVQIIVFALRSNIIFTGIINNFLNKCSTVLTNPLESVMDMGNYIRDAFVINSFASVCVLVLMLLYLSFNISNRFSSSVESYNVFTKSISYLLVYCVLCVIVCFLFSISRALFQTILVCFLTLFAYSINSVKTKNSIIICEKDINMILSNVLYYSCFMVFAVAFVL